MPLASPIVIIGLNCRPHFILKRISSLMNTQYIAFWLSKIGQISIFRTPVTLQKRLQVKCFLKLSLGSQYFSDGKKTSSKTLN